MAETKLLVIVQARLSSQRLPGKVLFPFGENTILETLVTRLKKSQSVSRVVIATSDEASDDELSDSASALGCQVYRGDLVNVFQRFHQVIKLSDEDCILRITADCPLICGELIDETYDVFLSNNLEFLSNSHKTGVVKGFDLEFIKRNTFLARNPFSLDNYDKEHVMPIFYEDLSIRKGFITYNFPKKKEFLNLSLDTHEDYDFLVQLERTFSVSTLNYRKIFEVLGLNGWRSAFKPTV